MVASDTLVGIVGAVILTIALVGVFVYEANAPGGENAFSSSSFSVMADGSTSYTPADDGGTPAPITNDDTPEQYTFECTISNLPELAGGELYYAVFLQKSSGNVFLDTMTKSGSDYTINYDEEADHSDADAAIVTLETTQNPSSPGIILFNATIGSNGDVSFNGSVSLALSEAQRLSVSQSGDAISVSGTLSNLPVHDGFMYRVWALDDASGGATWRVVANISMPDSGATFSPTVEGSASAQTEDGFDRVFISLESADSTQTVMSGFPLYQLDLN